MWWMRLGRGEGFVESAPRIGRQIVEHDADRFNLGIAKVDEIDHAFGEVAAVRRSVILNLRMARWASRNMNRLVVQLHRENRVRCRWPANIPTSAPQ